MHAAARQRRTDVDDITLTLPDHQRQHGPVGEKYAVEVHIDGLSPSGKWQIQQLLWYFGIVLEAGNRRRKNQQIDTAELLGANRCHLGHVIRIGSIKRAPKVLSRPEGYQIFDRLIDALAAAPDHKDIPSARRKSARNSLANTAAAADDNADVPLPHFASLYREASGAKATYPPSPRQ